MMLPQRWRAAIEIVVTKCQVNPMGGTDFACSFDGAEVVPITLDGVQVGDAPGQRGLDDVRSQLEQLVREQVARALELAR
jgi:hypothetical protein